MHLNAVCLCDNLMCHLISSQQIKSVLLVENILVVFEGEELFFSKEDRWYVHVNTERFTCENLRLQFGKKQLELIFEEITESFLQCGSLRFDHDLSFGTSLACDGVFSLAYEGLTILLKRKERSFIYEVNGCDAIYINQKRTDHDGIASFPSILQIHQLILFVGCDVVVFNHCAVSSQIRASESICFPVKKRMTIIEPHYIPVLQCHLPVIHFPEFESGKSVQRLSLWTIGPMVLMSGASLYHAMMIYDQTGQQNALVMPLVMLINAILWPCLNSFFTMFHELIQKHRNRKSFLLKCEQLNHKLDELKSQVLKSCINPELADDELMWQIRKNHPQFMKLVLGTGQMHFSISVKGYPIKDDMEVSCRQALAKLEKNTKWIEDGLVQCDLNEHRFIGFVCHDDLSSVVLKVIVSLGILMDLNDVNHILFCSDESITVHLRKTALFYRTIVDETVSSAEVQQLLNTIGKDNLCYVVDTKRAMKISSFAQTNTRVMVFLKEDDLIPAECTQVFHVREKQIIEKCEISMLYQNECVLFHQLNLLSQSYCRAVDAERENPDFLNQFGYLDAGAIVKRWHHSTEPIAILGVDERNEKIELNLSEHHEGPHGLIAGMTGSGKSILLLNMLLSIAVNSSPNDVRMLIIDYKGGSLFQLLEVNGKRLPHLAGSLSNHYGGIGRALSSISYECLRRQKLFYKAHQLSGKPVSTLKEYRELVLSYSLEPLAELLIVVDEFAELKKEEPDFMSTLISLARTGRSLGLHLILCTQKISGVVDDEIIGNTKFKIALKIATEMESKALVDSVDAAYFTEAGQFILKSDQLNKKGKSPYCLKQVSETVRCDLINSTGNVLGRCRKSEDGLRQSEVLIDMICEAALQIKLHPDELWLKPLVPFDASSYLKKHGFFLGMMDLPEVRKQEPLYLSMNEHLLYGVETYAQRNELIQYALRQLLIQNVCVYYVQLISHVIDQNNCITASHDQMKRFIQKMSQMQSERTVIVVDDLNEFLGYFDTVSELCRFLMKASLRNIQVIGFVRKPFSLSSSLLEQFTRKLIFSFIDDAESMTLFHHRRNNTRVELASQAYTLMNEKLVVVQLGYLNKTLKMKRQLNTVDFLPEVVMCINQKDHLIGIDMDTLDEVYCHDSLLIVCGVQKQKIKEYCDLMKLESEIMDVFELQERYTRKSIREQTVLWIGPQIQNQMLFQCDFKHRYPAQWNEGMLIKDGNMRLIRLYDQ